MPPDWAGGHTAGGFARMISALRDAYVAIGYTRTQLQLDDAALLVGRPETPSMELRVNLINISITLSRLPLDDWDEQIATFVASADELIIGERQTPWEEAEPRLRVRLYGADGLSGLLTPGRRLAPELLLCPVLDFPTAARVVVTEELERWGKSVEELIELGLRQTVEHEPLPEPQRMPIAPVGVVLHFVANSIYVASHLARLGELVGDAPHGALVAVPRRNVLMLHPIRDVTAVFAVDVMTRVAAQICDAGPYSLSHALYWWRDSGLTNVSRVDRGRTRIKLPPELAAIFAALMPGRPATAPSREGPLH